MDIYPILMQCRVEGSCTHASTGNTCILNDRCTLVHVIARDTRILNNGGSMLVHVMARDMHMLKDRHVSAASGTHGHIVARYT